jgi:hypothetical protein
MAVDMAVDGAPKGCSVALSDAQFGSDVRRLVQFVIRGIGAATAWLSLSPRWQRIFGYWLSDGAVRRHG